MSTLMGDFLNTLDEAVIVVDSQGRIRFVNDGARALTGLSDGAAFPDVQLCDHLATAADAGPRTMTVGGLQADRSIEVVVARLPAPGLFAVTLRDRRLPADYEEALGNLFDYIDTELARPITQLAGVIAGECPQPLPVRLANARAEALQAAQGLGRIRLFADLFHTHALVDCERLPIPELVRDVLDAEGERLAKAQIEIRLGGLDQDLPPVYGSRVWLTHALRELTINALEQSAAETTIGIDLQCTGAHVVIRITNHGHYRPKSVGALPVFVPFHRVAEYRRTGKMPANAIPGRTGNHPPHLGLGLPLCQRIVALHGGRLHLPREGDDGVVEVGIELATGAPAADQEQQHIEQAKRYAQDLAALMQRLRQRQHQAQNG